MKILRSKTRNARRALSYNEEKVSEGYASVIGGTINISGREDYELATDELKLVIKAHNERPDKVESFGKRSKFSFKPEVVHRSNKLALMMEQFVKIKSRREVKPFQHLKISLHPDDNEKLSNRTLRKISEATLEKMGYGNCPFIIYRHKDTDHPHVHIVLSRYDFNGNLISDSYEGLRTRRIEREIAKEFELTRSQDKLLSERGIRQTQKWEGRRMLKTGEKSQKLYVQCSIIEALQGKPSLEQFVQRLERRGIQIAHRETQRGSNVYHGLSYKIRPELRKVNLADVGYKFDGGDIEQKLYGISFEDWFGFKGSMKGNSRELPEFCPQGISPTELKPYSFRAGTLGPFFQFERIQKLLSDFDTEILNKITVRKKEYEKLVPITLNESKEESSLIMALESRLETPAAKLLKDHPTLKSGINERLTSNHRIFYNSLIAKLGQEEENPLSLLEQYQNLYFKKTKGIATGPTLAVLQFLSQKNYVGLDKYLTVLGNNNQKGPDIAIIEIFGIRARSAKLMEDLQIGYLQRLEDHESYFSVTHERHPRGKDYKLFEYLASGSWDKAVNEIENQNSKYSREYLELLITLETIPKEVRSKLSDFITFSERPSIEIIKEDYKNRISKVMSSSTLELLDAAMSGDDSRIKSVIQEYKFYPDHLKPDPRVLEIFNHGLNEEIVNNIRRSFSKSETLDKQMQNPTEVLIDCLNSGESGRAWQEIVKNEKHINFDRVTFENITRIGDDRNLYHFLFYLTTGAIESKPVHEEVRKLLDSGVNPHYDQTFVLAYETGLLAKEDDMIDDRSSSKSEPSENKKSIDKGKSSESSEQQLPK
jgi:hypothetical protein